MHALGSWCERYRSGTGVRQSDRSSLWIKTRSALRLYFARSAPRSLHAPLRSHALVQTRAMRICCGVFRNFPVSALLIEIGEMPLWLRHFKLGLQYWIQLGCNFYVSSKVFVGSRKCSLFYI